MIYAVPRLSSDELAVLAQIDEMKTQLGFSTRTPSRRWSGLLRRNSLARAIQGSNSIEGFVVTKDDAVAAAENAEPLEASDETWQAITGYRDAMTYVLQLADDQHFSYASSLIKSLHFMMMKYDLAKRPGSWRPGPIYVQRDDGERVYEGSEAQLLPALVEELVEDLNRAQPAHCIVKAAMAHLNLVMIHPFSDGNGRMARCLQALVLARDGNLHPVFCSIEEYLGRNTPAYYDVLAAVGGGKWRPTHDARPWMRFCLRAHFFQVSTQIRRMKELALIWNAVEEEATRRRLPERVIVALVDAAQGYGVRNASYRKSAEVSEQTASRDLKDLVEQGLLVAAGERRGRTYLGSPTLRELFERLKLPRDIRDPFAKPRKSSR